MIAANKKKVAGIILAAGTSSRMGRTKQLLPYKGATILGAVVENALAADLDPVILVLGCDAARIEKTLRQQMDVSKLKTTFNPDFKNGQSSSIVQGLKNVENNTDAAMFLLGDQPQITPATLNYLVDTFKKKPVPIMAPCYEGQRGNPVIFSRSLFPELRVLEADTGARILFKKHAHQIRMLAVTDPAIVTDIDTPLDYQQIIEQ